MKNLNYPARVLYFYKIRREEGHRPQQAKLIAKHDAKYGERSPKLAMMPSPYAAYDGEETTTLPNGWQIKVEFQRDDDMCAPWKEHDGHGYVYETHEREEHMDDWELNSERGWYRYYDWKKTLPLAIKDLWDAKPYGGNKQERAMRAMKHDCEWLRRWCQDDWWWCGMTVTLLDENDFEIDSESCWGYDSDSIDYLCSEARNWAARMICKERKVRQAVRSAIPIRDAMSEGARV